MPVDPARPLMTRGEVSIGSSRQERAGAGSDAGRIDHRPTRPGALRTV